MNNFVNSLKITIDHDGEQLREITMDIFDFQTIIELGKRKQTKPFEELQQLLIQAQEKINEKN